MKKNVITIPKICKQFKTISKNYLKNPLEVTNCKHNRFFQSGFWLWKDARSRKGHWQTARISIQGNGFICSPTFHEQQLPESEEPGNKL